jgi:NAD(P)-dependent dehydrogenase (short-subunit alcohol dehydrogenase family)
MKSVLITGANRGIGLAFATAYLQRGWKVYAACRDMGRVGELLELGGDVEVVPLDVTSMEEIEALAGMLKGKTLDVLINNAAVHGPRDATGTFGNIDPEAWMEVFRVNTIGPVKVTEALLPNVLMGGDRKLVFISSMAGSISMRGSQPHHRTGGPYIYRTSKAALNAAVKAIGYDLRQKGVSVVTLHPGWVKTETGGWDAPGEPSDSVAAMMPLIDAATPEGNGVFLNVDGSVIGW